MQVHLTADVPGWHTAQAKGRDLHSAQWKCFLCHRECTESLCGGWFGGARGHSGMFRVHFVSEMAQVELKGGRV